MWNDIYLIHRVLMTKKVNGWLYFIQKLPWIGKKIPSKVYQFIKLKRFLGILAMLSSLLTTLIKNALYLFVIIALPVMLVSIDGDNTDFAKASHMFLMIYLLLTGCCGAIVNSKLLTADDETYIMTRLLHMEVKRYFLNQSLYRYGWNTITLGITAISLTFLLRIPFWYGLLCAIMYLCSHFSADACYVFLYDHKKSKLFLSNRIKAMVPCLCFGIAIAIIWLHPFLSFAMPLFLGLSALYFVSSLWAFHYLKQSDSYKDISIPLIDNSMNLLTISKSDSHGDVKLNEKDYTQEELKKGISTKKHGYAYMNELFFQRHKRLINKPIKRRLLILLGSTILFAILSFFIKDLIRSTSLMLILPPFVFFLFLLNISEKSCRAMFMNCDVSLLHYGYYRQKEAIFTNFRIRLKTLSKYNLFLGVLFCLEINLLAFLYNIAFTWQTLLLFDMTLIMLSIFFSVHYLFVYYIFQPYNEELDMKNPFMAILNGIIYFLCYLSIKIEGSYLFTFGVLIATLLYIIIALFLVYRLAPKTFHLK